MHIDCWNSAHAETPFGVRAGITLLCALLAVAIGPATALAQSGSAGGSIGNDEKSVSGTRQAPRSVETEKPARRSKPAAEEPRRAARKSGGRWRRGNFDGAWVAHSVGTTCGANTERFVVAGGRIIGRTQFRSCQPEWLDPTSAVPHPVCVGTVPAVSRAAAAPGHSCDRTAATDDGRRRNNSPT